MLEEEQQILYGGTGGDALDLEQPDDFSITLMFEELCL